MPLDHRHLGDTGLTVSVMGLGLAALGRPAYINLGHGDDLPEDRSRPGLEGLAHTMLDRAHEAGITYFDAARSYGDAEAFLGSWIRSRRMGRADLTVGSKWGYVYVGGWEIEADVHEIKRHDAETLEHQLAETRRTLGDHLDLYQIHSATLESAVLENASVLGRLADLREEGVVIGLSTSGPAQSEVIRRAIDLAVDGERLFGVLQSTWNLLEPSAGPALAEAADAGLGVIVKEAVANGRLTDRNRRLSSVFASFDFEWSVDAVALAAAIGQSFASVVLSGAVTPEQLRRNLQATEVPQEVVDSLPDLTEPAGEYWRRRSHLPWT